VSVVKGEVHRSSYRDSIALMRVAGELSRRDGVARAEVLMGTPANLEALRASGLLAPELAGSTPADLVVAVEAETEEIAAECLEQVHDILVAGRTVRPGGSEEVYSLAAAQERVPHANLALISIPGQYATREAMRALERGLNVMVFSDHVPLEDEIELKRRAGGLGLLVMGPDCGAAIIGGVGLGFSNRVRRGEVGLVAASGTGLQEVSCLVDRAGLGISHAIGTGSNDVKAAVGGSTVIRGLRILEKDPETRVIVLITKPPEEAAAERILEAVRGCSKPVVVGFLGSDGAAAEAAGASVAATLEDAARRAVEACGAAFSMDEGDWERLERARDEPRPGPQRFVRGVFSGGTLAAEAALVLSGMVEEVSTNTNLRQARPLEDPRRSVGHTCVDLGDDEFTRGKPHPMLEPSMRDERILQEAADPHTAVLLLDVVLGFAGHPDPAAVLADTLGAVRRQAASAGRHVPVVLSVCGTDADPQSRSGQVATLREAGALVSGSNAEAARAAATLALGAVPPEVSAR
jgi:succinyl-CoA synthetase alpha subunit